MENSFFGIGIDAHSPVGEAMVLLMAVLLGGLIGFEREWRGHPAGLRTHVLVCVGATLITLTSMAFGRPAIGGTPSDMSRIAANIVVGIGFLGAGAIVRDGVSVHGLTTAASIWTTAAIGLSLGVSPRQGQLAVTATAIVLMTLSAMAVLEGWLKHKRRVCPLDIEVYEADGGPSKLFALLVEQQIAILGVTMQSGAQSPAGGIGPKEATCLLRLRVKLPGHFDRNRFNAVLADHHDFVRSFQME